MSDDMSAVTGSADSTLVLAKIGKTHGIKGWVRLISFTSPETNVANYRHFQGASKGLKSQSLALEMDDHKLQGNGLIAHFKGYDDPETARQLTGVELAINSAELPTLPEGEYYWFQLQGLQVVNPRGECFGEVKELLETGANDVIVVVPNQNSIDDQERLIPFLKERVVLKVDLDSKQITVAWEADYLS